jgi:hypothetical protein
MSFKTSVAISSLSVSILLSLSCVTANSAAAQLPAAKNQIVSGKPKTADNIVNPPKIQQEFQNEFARQLVKAGEKAEGWALFSDSTMGHNGQHWIIRTNDPKNNTINLCAIKQGDTTCQNTAINAKQFAKIQGFLKTADGLKHILPTVFDGISFEYLHATSSVPELKRVVFLTSAKPFPSAYEDLINAFKP